MGAKFLSESCDASLDLVFICVLESVVLEAPQAIVFCDGVVGICRRKPSHPLDQVLGVDLHGLKVLPFKIGYRHNYQLI